MIYKLNIKLFLVWLKTTLLAGFLGCSLRADYYQGRAPICGRPVAVFTYPGFMVGYCNETRTALWTVMAADHAWKPIQGCLRSACLVPELRAEPQILSRDFANHEGLVRGHLTPAAGVAYVYGCRAGRSTNITSNCVPAYMHYVVTIGDIQRATGVDILGGAGGPLQEELDPEAFERELAAAPVTNSAAASGLDAQP